MQAEAVLPLINQRSLLPPLASAAAGFVAGEDGADMALRLQRPMAVPKSPKQGGYQPQWGVRGEEKDTRRRGRKQPSETVSKTQQFISFFYKQGFLACAAAGGTASLGAGESREGQKPSSLQGAGAPRASSPCPGQERKGCGCSPGQRGLLLLLPRPAPPGAAPALQGQARMESGRAPRGGWLPTCRCPLPRWRLQGCRRRPAGWGWEPPGGRQRGQGWLCHPPLLPRLLPPPPTQHGSSEGSSAAGSHHCTGQRQCR